MLVGKKFDSEINKYINKAIKMIEEGSSMLKAFEETGCFLGNDNEWRSFLSDKNSFVNLSIIVNNDGFLRQESEELIFVEKIKRNNDFFEFYDDDGMIFSIDSYTLKKSKIPQKQELLSLKNEDYIIKPFLLETSKFFNFKINDIFNHDELFDGYKDLKDYKIQVNLCTIDSKKGAYVNSSKKTICLYISENDNKDKLKKSIIHELQHAIQDKEGFYKGSNWVSERIATQYITSTSMEEKQLLYKRLKDIKTETLSELDAENIAALCFESPTEDLELSLMMNSKSKMLKLLKAFSNDEIDEETMGFNEYYNTRGEMEARFAEQACNSEFITIPSYLIINSNFTSGINDEKIREDDKNKLNMEFINICKELGDRLGTKITIKEDISENMVFYSSDLNEYIVKPLNLINYEKHPQFVSSIKRKILKDNIVRNGLKGIFGKDYIDKIDEIGNLINKNDPDYIKISRINVPDKDKIEHYLAIKLDKEKPSKMEVKFIRQVKIIVKKSIAKIFRIKLFEDEIIDLLKLSIQKNDFSKKIKNFIKNKKETNIMKNKI